MNQNKLLGFICGILMVFLMLILLIGGVLIGFFFHNQQEQCAALDGYHFVGINQCEKITVKTTDIGVIETKEKIQLNEK
jgi:hypothetical protein